MRDLCDDCHIHVACRIFDRLVHAIAKKFDSDSPEHQRNQKTREQHIQSVLTKVDEVLRSEPLEVRVPVILLLLDNQNQSDLGQAVAEEIAAENNGEVN